MQVLNCGLIKVKGYTASDKCYRSLLMGMFLSGGRISPKCLKHCAKNRAGLLFKLYMYM